MKPISLHEYNIDCFRPIIAAVYRSDRLYEILENAGPLDGYCRETAWALQQLFGGNICGLFYNDHWQHDLLVVDGTYGEQYIIDGSGIYGTLADYYAFWQEFGDYRSVTGYAIRPYDSSSVSFDDPLDMDKAEKMYQLYLFVIAFFREQLGYADKI